ncbi:MAG: FliH/SctL family protein [Anaerovoracaceae bacterium]
MSNIVKANSFSNIKYDNNDYEIKENVGLNKKSWSQEMKNVRDSIIRQALKKSQHIEQEATKRANEIVECAFEQSQNIMKDAENKGYQEGYAKGLSEGTQNAGAKAEAGLKEIQDLIQSIQTEKQAAFERQEKELIRIAFEIAKKIMRQQVQIDENVIPDMLKELIHDEQEHVKIYLSEYQKTLDLYIDKNVLQKINNLSKNTNVIMVQGEDVIKVETENGIIDLSLNVQLDKLEEAISNI